MNKGGNAPQERESMLNERQVRNASEAISRGEACPACQQDWTRPAPPAAWSLTHAPTCEYIAALDRLDIMQDMT